MRAADLGVQCSRATTRAAEGEESGFTERVWTRYRYRTADSGQSCAVVPGWRMRVLWKSALMIRSALSPLSSAPLRNNSGNAGGAGESLEVRCFRLKDRCVLNIRGPDTAPYLQGLITNDMQALQQQPGPPALYSHLLTTQGRTLYDVIIYRMEAGPDDISAVLVECDASVQDAITRHLKTYRVRRKVTVEARTDLTLWSLLPPADHPRATSTPEPRLQDRKRVVVMVPDPRTQLMGWRLITGAQDNPAQLIAACNHGNVEDYHQHRYTLGVPEGVRDLPPGDALPLESNLLFLNGISFTKGCYLGQELTARTHHTGVIRKRLMPLHLSVPVDDLPPGAPLQSTQGKPAGKLRAGIGRVGLGLVRLSHARETLLIRTPAHTVTLTASLPEWWSQDLRNQLS